MNVVDIDDLCMGCMEPRQGLEVCAACGYREGTPPDNPVHLPPRTRLKDCYLVGRVLGHGGFGIAYIAYETNLQIKLAVKEFFPGDFATRGVDRATVAPYSGDARDNFEYGLTKFLDEGRAVARFNDHPGIVPVLNFFRDNGTGYLVMQYVPGMSLKEYLNLKDGRIPYEEATAITMPVMDTLRAVHEVGLLHRDISPDNIYISTAKRVKLLDFGAARLAMRDRSKSLSVILKAGYAPFEQYQTKGKQGPWTDVYALAATIYRSVTGVIPPEAPSRIAGTEVLELPRTLGVDMPAAAEDVLMQALAIDPQQRIQTVALFQEALLDANQQSPQVAPRRRTEPRTAPVAPPAAFGQTAAQTAAQRAATSAQAVPAANVLKSVIDVIAQPIEMVSTLLQQQFGLQPAPEDQAAVSRRGVLLAAVIIGALGVLWTLSVITTLAGILSMAASLPVFVGFVRAAIGCVGAGLMVIGALGGLMGDRRGTTIVWGVGCLLIAAGIAGGVFQVLTYIPTASAGIIWFSLTSEMQGTLMALLPTAIILLLLWLRTSVRTSTA
jgi:serine/threonine protein kinase